MKSTPTRPIDWDEIRRRLEVAERALSEAPTLTAAQRRAAMEARARAVAARTPAAPDTVAALDVVEFTLANHRLAIESVHVREMLGQQRMHLGARQIIDPDDHRRSGLSGGSTPSGSG